MCSLGGDGITRKLTDVKVSKVKELAKLGLSNTAIGRALHISEAVVRNYRGSGNDKKVDGNKKRAGKKRDSGPGRSEYQNDKTGIRDKSLDPLEKYQGDRDNPGSEKRGSGKRSRKSGKTKTEPSFDIDRSQGSTTKGITFVGGKKDMSKKDEDSSEESEEYECAECGAAFSGKKDVCPKCGAELDPEAYDE